MGRKGTKNQVSFLFLLTAAAGIFMFLSAWNSFLNGKAFIFLSLLFLILFLTGIIWLYLIFIRLCSTILTKEQTGENISDNGSYEEGLAPTPNPSGRDATYNLLKGAFAKNDAKSIGEKILKNLSQEFEIIQGVFFILKPETSSYVPAALFAIEFDMRPSEFAIGEGITGQAVADNKIVVIANLPEHYSPAISGLGKGKARFLYIIPLVFEKNTYGVFEISMFKEIDDNKMSALNQLMREGGMKLFSVLFQDTK